MGDELEIMKPDGTDVKVKVNGMYREDGTPVDSCPHSKEVIYLDLSEKPSRFDILRVSAGEGASE